MEAVVLRHLEEQLEALGHEHPMASAAVAAIVADEMEHHASAAATAGDGFWHKVLTPVATSTEVVIWLGMRL